MRYDRSKAKFLKIGGCIAALGVLSALVIWCSFGLKGRPATDSASAGTAISTGVKTEKGNVAWAVGDQEGGALTTLCEWVRAEVDGGCGIVTTAPFSHATPGAFAAHNRSRKNYQPIADEIVFETRPQLVIGAGHPHFNGTADFNRHADEKYMSEETYHALRDGGTEYIFVERTDGTAGSSALAAAARKALGAGSPLFGLYGGPLEAVDAYRAVHAPGAPRFETTNNENPTLAEASTQAMSFLAQAEQRFFLLVEGGEIDWANHDNDYRMMIEAMHNFEQAVRAAVALIDTGSNLSWSDTMIIVTADHGNSYLKLNPAADLGPGVIPEQTERPGGLCANFDCGRFLYPGGEVSYPHGDHTNELVTLAAKGAGAALFEDYDNRYRSAAHPTPRIVDNTDIHKVITTTMTQPSGPRHVILFLGDGMHEAHEAAYSKYLYGTDDALIWDAAAPPTTRFDYIGWSTTWDVTTYNRYANQREQKPFEADSFDPTIGYDPNRGGWRPVVYTDQTTGAMDDYYLSKISN